MFLNLCSEGLAPPGGSRKQLLRMEQSASNYWPFVHILTRRKYPEATIFLEWGVEKVECLWCATSLHISFKQPIMELNKNKQKPVEDFRNLMSPLSHEGKSISCQLKIKYSIFPWAKPHYKWHIHKVRNYYRLLHLGELSRSADL